MDGAAYTLVGPAAAEVAGHGPVYVGIARPRIFGQERRGRHDLSLMTVAALGYVLGHPGLLDRMTVISGKTLDGDDLLTGNR